MQRRSVMTASVREEQAYLKRISTAAQCNAQLGEVTHAQHIHPVIW